MLDLSRQYASIRTEILAAVARVCDSQHYILGEEVTAFEREFAALCATADCVGCASGTDGLWLALAAAGIGPGDSVITTPFSFFATASSILRAGAKPVFADVDPETLNLDPASVEDRLKTAPRGMHALMPVHLYGQCADMDAFQRLAAEFKVHLVEDAAQAVGASWNGKHAGSLGLAAAFSFYPTKNLSAFGDAGAVTTSNATLAERMRSLRNHGGKQRYFHDEVGANSRLDSIQAAVLRVKMSYLARWNEARRERARTYGRLLTSAGLTRTGAASLAPIVLLKTFPFADFARRVPHLSPVCGSSARSRQAAYIPGRARHWLRDLLSHSAAFAEVFCLSRARSRRLARSRTRRTGRAGIADLS